MGVSVYLRVSVWKAVVVVLFRVLFFVFFCHSAVMKAENNLDRETCVISAGRQAASSLSLVSVARPVCLVYSAGFIFIFTNPEAPTSQATRRVRVSLF